MTYTDLIFDLYGTLLDIHTEPNLPAWEKTALFYGFYGAHYTGTELHDAFHALMNARNAQAGQSYESFPDVPWEPVFAQLFRDKGICENADTLAISAAQLFRICAIDYIRLYPQVVSTLKTLRQKGFRLWLLSNAQAVFTNQELRLVGLSNLFDGIYLSSDYNCRKPDSRFFRALLEEQQLDPSHCLMIGNDRETDIAGAQAMGLDTLYLHTNLTPSQQKEADPALHPAVAAPSHHYEFEGWDWAAIGDLLETL